MSQPSAALSVAAIADRVSAGDPRAIARAISEVESGGAAARALLAAILLSRYDVLLAAGAAEAKVMLIAVDDPEQSLKTANLVRRRFPALTVVANALRVADALASSTCASEPRAANHMAQVSMFPAT